MNNSLKVRVMSQIGLMFLCIGVSTPAAFAGSSNPPIDSQKKYDCSEDSTKCVDSARACGDIAGLKWGVAVCSAKSQRPHPDYVWQRETIAEHCMGFLPIIATQMNPVLKHAFETAYASSFVNSMKASGCESVQPDQIPTEAQSSSADKAVYDPAPGEVDPGFVHPSPSISSQAGSAE